MFRVTFQGAEQPGKIVRAQVECGSLASALRDSFLRHFVALPNRWRPPSAVLFDLLDQSLHHPVCGAGDRLICAAAERA
jgi:hypothetical protein